MNQVALMSSLIPCYAGVRRVPIVVCDKQKDRCINWVLSRLGIIPAIVDCDEQAEKEAYSIFRSKYDRKTAAAYAHVTGMILGSDLFCGNGLAWAMQKTENEMTAVEIAPRG